MLETFDAIWNFITVYLMHPAIILVWMHFFADFILQSDSMATKKSSSNKWLGLHIAAYSLPFFLWLGWYFALINGIAHFITDWCTSRITSKLWAEKKVHWFFVTIGFDQAIHITTLLISYQIIFGF